MTFGGILYKERGKEKNEKKNLIGTYGDYALYSFHWHGRCSG